MATTYQGDEALNRLLEEDKSAFDAAAVRDLIAGVLAAPAADPGDSWIVLAAPRAGNELTGQLAALKEEIASALGDPAPWSPDRLADLRAFLKDTGLNGIVVPRSDEHLGEYVAKRSERLAWATGFTGSAGLAVILAERAALFVDGRYTLQAAQEVDAALFEILPLAADNGDWPPGLWISEQLSEGAKLGYDPWLHTSRQVSQLGRAAEKAGAELTACPKNPIDAVWKDQPPPPLAPVFPLADDFTGSPSAEKRAGLAATLKQDGEEAAVLSAPDSIAWLLNIRGGDVPFSPLPLSFAILNGDATVDLFIDGRKLTPEAAASLGDGVRIATPDAFGAALDRLGKDAKTVRVDSGLSPAWISDRLKEAGARLKTGDDPCQRPKACKNETELDGMRAAHRRDGAALTRFLAWLERAVADGGISEIDAADQLEALRRQGDHFRGLSFPTISGFGPNGAIVHYRVTSASNRILEPASLYLVDSGAQYLDGTTDVTRTVAIGDPNLEMRDRFTRVLKGHIALARAVFPKGTSGSQLDVLARRALWEAGLDYAHGTGHGVGSFLGVHEGPQRISKLPNRVALEQGMVVSVEPGYYKEGAYGIRIENLVAVIPASVAGEAETEMLAFEPLTLAPIDLALVEPGLLDAAERDWLNDYHARVADEITPLVDDETATWLKLATRPLEDPFKD